MICRTILMLLIAGLFGWPTDKANAQSAPVPCKVKFGPHAIDNGMQGGTLHCRCESGFEFRENTCKPIPTMSAKPQPTMRAMTRPECVRGAGQTLKTGLDSCSSSAVDCLKNEDVDWKIVECTGAGLGATIASLASIPEPTQLAKIAAALTVTSAMAACRSSAKEINSICSPNWGSCKEDKLKVWKADIAACPAK